MELMAILWYVLLLALMFTAGYIWGRSREARRLAKPQQWFYPSEAELRELRKSPLSGKVRSGTQGLPEQHPPLKGVPKPGSLDPQFPPAAPGSEGEGLGGLLFGRPTEPALPEGSLSNEPDRSMSVEELLRERWRRQQQAYQHLTPQDPEKPE